MLQHKTFDDMIQLKRFILTYYRPLLAKLDIEQFENDIETDYEKQLAM